MSALVLFVRMHEGRYHGEGDWPPSPARLFQALVAGAGLGGPLAPADRAALEWLERLAPPVLAAPCASRPRRGVRQFMPNNDSDSIGGDPAKMSKIRTATKISRPHLFDATVPFVYAWALPEEGDGEGKARAVCALADRLYQLGRGVDMAFAWGEILADRERDEVLANHPGKVFFPSSGSGGIALSSPCPGSLESVLRRHREFGNRFQYQRAGRSSVRVVFRRPPAPRFGSVSYDAPPARRIYELREPTGEALFSPWPLERATEIVVRVRDGAVKRLVRALPGRNADVERALVGRRPDGTNDAPLGDRIRILPLPSIGHVHADRRIRRLLVEIPPTCPLRADDVHWAFSGLDAAAPGTGETGPVLLPATDLGFARHFGVDEKPGFRSWRTVTPAALPADAARRRIEPTRKRQEAKAAGERVAEQARAARAVRHAIRHAGVRADVERIRVQREPFDGGGERVEAFARDTRFAKERLWHVEVTFDAPVAGPLAIGDGRFLGLGVMAPVRAAPGVHALRIVSGLAGSPDPEGLARAFRRAVMARVQEVLGERPLPGFFSGHDREGRPLRAERSSHLAFACDLPRARLLSFAPHALDGRGPTAGERRCLAVLEQALAGMTELRAGAAGCLALKKSSLDADEDPLTRPSTLWESVTPYTVTRHRRKGDAAAALSSDLIDECGRRGLPRPREVTVLQTRAIAGKGLLGRVRLRFATAVKGPIVLGRTRFVGGGLFAATDMRTEAAPR